ncbi:MAG TPA: YciI family protein [Candidatus Kryptonia bacterium]
MKYVCLGYIDDSVWQKMTQSAQNNFVDACFAYDDELRKNGHYVGGEGLESAHNAATLRPNNGRVTVTDGPFAETKEQIGGIMILEARDLNHAIQIMSRHPSLKLGGGCWEIRPASDLTSMIAESEQRRSGAK